MTHALHYQDGDTSCHGQLFLADSDAPTPLIVVVHDWSGCNQMACDYAQAVTDLGYAGFAVDMYGNGTLGKDNEEKTALMMALKNDRAALLARVNAGIQAACLHPEIDAEKVVVIGFCFGGLVALDVARSGADIAGVVSFHGLLDNEGVPAKNEISAKVLALTGDRDPMVTHEQVGAFQQEMRDAKADWQMVTYGNTYHAFMNPDADDPEFGTVYNELAAARAWDAMQLFLLDCFETEIEHEHDHSHESGHCH